jgi:type I pantothenate kinase
MDAATGTEFSAYVVFRRDEWAALRASTPLTLSEADLATLRGVHEQLSIDEVVQIYLPLSRLLNLHFRSARALSGVKDEFLGRLVGRRPYVIGIAGSVAVGKSTFARTLRALLARWPDHPSVELVTTDGFLYPNATLLERGLMKRKGFPESYDRRRMIQFLADVKAGSPRVGAPVYSHQGYDIVPGGEQVVASPDVLIFEGLNVLQTGTLEGGRSPSIIVSDFFDFSLYLDADDAHIQEWYVARFQRLQRTVFQNPASYFHHYKDLDAEQSREVALGIWRDINLANLRENILPSRERAHVVLRKRADHGIGEVWLRQI